MKQRIIIDFDGTIVDTRARQFQLFCELSGISSLGLETYWDLKRSGVSTATLLQTRFAFDSYDISVFRRRWLSAIEDPSLLEMDTLFSGSFEALRRLSASYDCVVLSGRQSLGLLIHQIGELGIGSFFEGVLVTEGKVSKDAVARQAGLTLNLALIGDSGEDILAAQRLGAVSVGALSGASSKDVLMRSLPDFIIPSVSELWDLLNALEGNFS